MKRKLVNFKHLAVISIGFLGLFSALFTAQSLSSLLFSKDSYDKLGFYSNGIIFLGQVIGSFLAVIGNEKIGDRKTIAYGALICIPFAISLVVPALNENPNND